MTLEEFLQLPAQVQDEVTQLPDCPIDFKREYLGDVDNAQKNNPMNCETPAVLVQCS